MPFYLPGAADWFWKFLPWDFVIKHVATLPCEIFGTLLSMLMAFLKKLFLLIMLCMSFPYHEYNAIAQKTVSCEMHKISKIITL